MKSGSAYKEEGEACKLVVAQARRTFTKDSPFLGCIKDAWEGKVSTCTQGEAMVLDTYLQVGKPRLLA